MSQPAAGPVDAPPPNGETGPLEVRCYRWMLLARAIEDKLASLYRAGKIMGGVYTGRGQEALSAALGLSLRPGDVFAPLIRDLAGRLAFGEPVDDSIRTYFGSPLGPMRGRDGNVHRGRPRQGLIPMISHLGATISVVNGVLLARKIRGQSGSVGAASIGDGATSTGAFHEALNQAAVEQLPLVLVVADNQYAYSTPTDRQFRCGSLADRAAGYGVRGWQVDGTQAGACLKTLGDAVECARRGEGPQLVVATLLRLGGHGEHDDSSYVADALRQSPLGRDCLHVAAEALVRAGRATLQEVEAFKTEAQREVEAVVARVQQEGAPDPYAEDWHAYATARF